jgi:hypothetical protein
MVQKFRKQQRRNESQKSQDYCAVVGFGENGGFASGAVSGHALKVICGGKRKYVDAFRSN